jgi:transposase
MKTFGKWLESINNQFLQLVNRQQMELNQAQKAGDVDKMIQLMRWFPSSKTCHICGEINENLTLADREWDCSGCSTRHDRDYNAMERSALA